MKLIPWVDPYTNEELSESENFLTNEDDNKMRRVKAAILFIESYRTLPLLAWPRLLIDKIVELEEQIEEFRFNKVKAVKKAGHPETRLIDATGEPYSSTNVAKDTFEKEAIIKLIEGASRYENVEINGDNRILRAATAVPIVSSKCIICHPNYSKIKKGKPVGVLVYTVPIE